MGFLLHFFFFLTLIILNSQNLSRKANMLSDFIDLIQGVKSFKKEMARVCGKPVFCCTTGSFALLCGALLISPLCYSGTQTSWDTVGI